MGAFTDATDQLFKDLYKEVDDYFNAIADAALKEDKDTWGDLNNFHYAASMAWQVQGIVATIGDEMKNQEKNRTDLGLWVGPAADVYGSAMKTLITFVERINTALQPDNPNPDFGTPTQPAQIPVSAYGWSQWLNVLYLWQVQVNIAVHDNWQKAYDWIGMEQTVSHGVYETYKKAKLLDDNKAKDAQLTSWLWDGDIYDIRWDFDHKKQTWFDGPVDALNNYFQQLNFAAAAVAGMPPDPIFQPNPNLKDPAADFQKQADDQKKEFDKSLDDLKKQNEKQIDDQKAAADKQFDDAKAAADKQLDDLNNADGKQIDDLNSKLNNMPATPDVPNDLGGAPGAPDLPKDLPGGAPTDIPQPGGDLAPPMAPIPVPPTGPAAPLVVGPDGRTGLDVTGNGIPDIGVDGLPLPNGDLRNAKLVTRPDGSRGLDLDGDGIPDIDTMGRPLAGGAIPPGGHLVSGADGTTGLDLTNNGVPDVGLDGRPLPGGDLPGARVVTGPDGTKGLDINGDGIPDVDLAGRGLPGSAAPGGHLQTGPDGTTGFDITGNNRPDLTVDGQVLPTGDLTNAQIVTGPDGTRGLDLNGDGIPDVDFGGRALPGGSAPQGSHLATGADGRTGFDVTGNNTPDVDIKGNPLPGGDLPPGTRAVVSANGTRGLDLNGDGVPDVDYAGHTLPGSGAPLNARLVNGPGGALGYDINGDGLPDFDLSGNPLAGAGVGVPGGPGSQVVAGPGAIFGRPFNGPQDATAAGLAPATAGQDVLAAGGAGAGAGGPMMPPMYPPQPGQDKDGRETWLQEEDDVWEGDEELVAAVALGRAPRAATDDVPDEAWEEPPAVPKKQRPGTRSGPRPRAGGPWPQGGAR